MTHNIECSQWLYTSLPKTNFWIVFRRSTYVQNALKSQLFYLSARRLECHTLIVLEDSNVLLQSIWNKLFYHSYSINRLRQRRQTTQVQRLAMINYRSYTPKRGCLQWGKATVSSPTDTLRRAHVRSDSKLWSAKLLCTTWFVCNDAKLWKASLLLAIVVQTSTSTLNYDRNDFCVDAV